MHLKPFLLTALDSATTGGRRYHLWMGSLTAMLRSVSSVYHVHATAGAFGRWYARDRDGKWRRTSRKAIKRSGVRIWKDPTP